MPARGLPILLLMSGAAALVYEIAWSRQLGLLFGHSSHAAAVVLAATFAGMAIGYAIGGRLARRLGQPLRGYGIAELVVAGWALLTPSLIGGLDRPPFAAWLDAESLSTRTFTRASAAFLVLLPATVALGATLPCVSHHLEARGRAGRETARAYAFNTAGAVLGVLAATFVLLVWLGVRGSGTVAAGLSALAGLGALSIADGAEEKRTLLAPSMPSTISTRFYALAALSGAGTLGLEVLYTRLFALTFHNSTYTFGLVVAVFLLALAAGGALMARRLQRGVPDQAFLAHLLFVAAAAIPISVALFSLVTNFGYFHVGFGFFRYVLGAFGLVALVVGPPVILLGTVLPWTWSAASAEAGETVGRLGAVNTVAAAVGALVTSFLLLPALGLFGGLLLVTAAYALAGLLLVSPAALRRRRATLALALVAIVSAVGGLVVLPRTWNPMREGQRLVRRWETPYGWVDVVERPRDGEMRIVQNLHYSFGSRKSTPAMKRLGHLPLLLHPRPERALFLGLATGLTSSAALAHPTVTQITVAELIPEVIEAARHFREVNGGVVDHPSVRVLAQDARQVLRTHGPSYDVIVSDLFVPWESQAGYLYTVDHYRLVRARLAEGGVFCQWLPLWQLGPRELGLIGDSLGDVFPHVSMWSAGTLAKKPLLALCGHGEPLRVSSAAMEARIRALPEPPVGREELLTSAKATLSLYLGDWPRAEGGPRNTDDHPRLEFLAPIAQQQNFRLVGHVFTNYLAAIAPLKREAIREAELSFELETIDRHRPRNDGDGHHVLPGL